MAQAQRKSSRGGAAAEDAAPRRRRKRTVLGRLIRRIVLLAVVIALIPIVLVPLYRVVDPPAGTVMLIARAGGAPITRRWVDLDAVSPHLVRAVLMAEDGRFCDHRGIDLEELRATIRAARQGKRPRGASTITMQTVKNLFLWPQRSYLRKALETPLALYADLVWSKRRTMELYLNIVEWDRGIYGAEAAARHHFGVSAAALSPRQAARLAATLPDPRGRDPVRPSRQLAALAALYERRARQSGAYVGCLNEQDK